MSEVRVFDIVGQRVLVSRESARGIKAALLAVAAAGPEALRLNFAGARGVAPTFLDEVLLVAEECIEESSITNTGTDTGGRAAGAGNDGAGAGPNMAVIFVDPPTALAAKHHVIARAHGRTLRQTDNGDWEFRVANEL